MSTPHSQDIWPADGGIETLQEFEQHRAFTQRATQKMIKDIANTYFKHTTSILEIGSGLGFLAQNIPQEYRERWIQLEAQPAFLAESKKRDPRGQFITGSAYSLPFPDQSIDAICGYCSFDVLSDINKAVGEVARVLTPGGTFIHLLDLGVDYQLIHKEFDQKRIPSFSKSQSNSIFPGISIKKTTFYYLPEQNIPAFLAEVRMTKEEMAQLPKIDACFALNHFQQKYNCDVDGLLEYFNIFEKYAVVLDRNQHFHNNLLSTLQTHFPNSKPQLKTLRAQWSGKRTEQQIKESPQSYFYGRDKGTLHIGACLYHQMPQYTLSQLIQKKFPKIADVIEPSCTEFANLECVIATKE